MFPSRSLRFRKPRSNRPFQIGFEDATTLDAALWDRLGFCQDYLGSSLGAVC